MQMHTVCSMVVSFLVYAAVVTSYFTGHWRQAAAHFEPVWSHLSDSFCVLQDSLDLSNWWHQRQSISSIVQGRFEFTVTLMLGGAVVPKDMQGFQSKSMLSWRGKGFSFFWQFFYVSQIEAGFKGNSPFLFLPTLIPCSYYGYILTDCAH